MRVSEIQTPAVVVDSAALQHNLDTMSSALPGARLRPHTKAHKCTELARRQADNGHLGFTCATIRECEGMAAAGLGHDLLLANEVLDANRLSSLVDGGHRVTLAVDSTETVEAAARGGVQEVVVDVNVGLSRCGCPPEQAGRIADLARSFGMAVRGVMGYEGHVMGLESEKERHRGCEEAMKLLLEASRLAGGDMVSAGGTGTFAVNTWATEIQAGSYVLMDTAYARQALPFQSAAFVLARVISASSNGSPSDPPYAVADCGLKAFGMDHGNPAIEGHDVWFCSDEHTTFSPPVSVGDLVLAQPAHIDPTIAYHSRIHVVDGLVAARAAGALPDAEVTATWEIDLRGW
jgi:D-serine deaminase-like pyridoxal phosphate-dependent protein